MCGATASGPTEPSRIIVPSGGALATCWCARLPPAPALLSMTIVWPRLSPNFLATMRAAVSAPPPGAKPTTIVIVLCGNSCAAAGHDDAASRGNRPAARRAASFIDGSPRRLWNLLQ
jgi:hypothetical protein